MIANWPYLMGIGEKSDSDGGCRISAWWIAACGSLRVRVRATKRAKLNFVQVRFVLVLVESTTSGTKAVFDPQ